MRRVKTAVVATMMALSGEVPAQTPLAAPPDSMLKRILHRS